MSEDDIYPKIEIELTRKPPKPKVTCSLCDVEYEEWETAYHTQAVTLCNGCQREVQPPQGGSLIGETDWATAHAFWIARGLVKALEV